MIFIHPFQLKALERASDDEREREWTSGLKKRAVSTAMNDTRGGGGCYLVKAAALDLTGGSDDDGLKMLVSAFGVRRGGFVLRPHLWRAKCSKPNTSTLHPSSYYVNVKR